MSEYIIKSESGDTAIIGNSNPTNFVVSNGIGSTFVLENGLTPREFILQEVKPADIVIENIESTYVVPRESSSTFVVDGAMRGPQGPPGTPGGPPGPTGETGATGAGVPAGGMPGEVLVKSTTDDYGTEWLDDSSINVKVNTTQEIVGRKTFSNDVIIQAGRKIIFDG